MFITLLIVVFVGAVIVSTESCSRQDNALEIIK